MHVVREWLAGIPIFSDKTEIGAVLNEIELSGIPEIVAPEKGLEVFSRHALSFLFALSFVLRKLAGDTERQHCAPLFRL